MNRMKNSSSGRKKRKNSSKVVEETQIDRLSELPDSIILHIFSLVNTKTVVQMCLLSKRWTNLWIYLPSLTLDSRSFNYKIRSFQKFVLHILSHQKLSHIHCLRFYNKRKRDLLSEYCIEKVIDYAVSHGVHEIYTSDVDFFELFSQTLQSLRTPKIQGKLYEYPVLASLTTLHLKGIDLANDSLDIFSSIVNLEELSLEKCEFCVVGEVLEINLAHLVNLTMFNVWFSSYNCELIISAPRLLMLNYKNDNLPCNREDIEDYEVFSVNGCSLLKRVSIFLPKYYAFDECEGLKFLYEKTISKIITEADSIKLRLASDQISFWKSNGFAYIEILDAKRNDEKIMLSWKLYRSEGEELVIKSSLLNRLGLVGIFGRVGFLLCHIVFLTIQHSRHKLAYSLGEIFGGANQKELESNVFSGELATILAGLQLAWDNAFVHMRQEESLKSIFKSQTEDSFSIQDEAPFADLKSVLSRNWECNVTYTFHDKVLWQMKWPK